MGISFFLYILPISEILMCNRIPFNFCSDLDCHLSLFPSLSPVSSSMRLLPQRNFVPFAVTMQCGDVAGAVAGAGAGAVAGAEAGAGAVAGDEVVAVAIVGGRRILLPRPRGVVLYDSEDICIYLCVFRCMECLCLSLQHKEYGLRAALPCFVLLLREGEGGLFWPVHRRLGRGGEGKMFCRL